MGSKVLFVETLSRSQTHDRRGQNGDTGGPAGDTGGPAKKWWKPQAEIEITVAAWWCFVGSDVCCLH